MNKENEDDFIRHMDLSVTTDSGKNYKLGNFVPSQYIDDPKKNKKNKAKRARRKNRGKK